MSSPKDKIYLYSAFCTIMKRIIGRQAAFRIEIYFTSPLILITCEHLRFKGGIINNAFYAIEKVGRLVGGIFINKKCLL